MKIDGEFIKELEHSEADRLTVQAIVQISRGLGKPRPVVLDPGFGVAA